MSWVLRAAPKGASEGAPGEPAIIDAFTWTPEAASYGTCPQVVADAEGVYWTTSTRSCGSANERLSR